MSTIGTITTLAVAWIVMQAYHERLQQECWPYTAVQKQWPIDAEGGEAACGGGS